jgi:hypothetical protein
MAFVEHAVQKFEEAETVNKTGGRFVRQDNQTFH